MKKILRFLLFGLFIFSSGIYAQTPSQIIPLQPAKGFVGTNSTPTYKLFFSPDSSIYLDFSGAFIPSGCYLRVGTSSGNYSSQLQLPGGVNLTKFIPKASLSLGTNRYYATVTNSLYKNLSGIQADAKSNSTVLYSNEIQFVVESPDAPIPTDPKGTTTASTPVFKWNAISGVPAYWIIVSSTPFSLKTSANGDVSVQGANIVWDYLTTDNFATYGQISPNSPFTKSAIPLFPGNTYYYTILNLYDANDVTFASTVFGGITSFTYTSEVTITAPNPVSPEEGQVFAAVNNIRFQWDPVPLANSYSVYLYNRVSKFQGNDQEIDLPVWNGTTTNTVIDFPARQNLLRGKYIWFVVPNSSTGAGNQSVKKSFNYNVTMSPFSVRLYDADDNSRSLINYTVLVNSSTGGYSPSVPYIVSNSSSMQDSLPSDNYQFSVKKTGFFDTSYSITLSGTSPNTLNVYIRQFPATVTGKILDKSVGGVAVQNANVQFTNITTNTVSTTTSNSAGEFTLGLPQASYRIIVSKPGYLSPSAVTVTVDQSQVIVSNPFILVLDKATLYGNVVNDNSEPVQLAVVKATKGTVVQEQTTNGNGNYSFQLSSGAWVIEATKSGFISPNPQTVNLVQGDNLQNQNVILIPRANQLTGTVYKIISNGSATTQAPFAGASVTATPTSGQATTVVTSSNGQYSFSLRTGSYTISTVSQGYTANKSSQVTLGVGQTLAGMDFTLTPNPSSVSGIITETDGALLSDALISNGTVSTSSLPTGSFQLSLPSGSHTLTVTKPGYITPETVSVTLVPGQALSGINFILDPNAASISGSVSSIGNSVAGATVTAVKGSTKTSALTDASGNFNLSVQPGSWTIAATKQGFLGSSSETFYIGAGQTSGNHNYSITPNTGIIKGVVATGGTPLTGASAVVKDINNSAISFSTSTDVKGEFSLTVPAEASYHISISLTGYTSYSNSPVTITKAGEVKSVNAPLNPVPASITGSVFDNQKIGLSQVKVYLINSSSQVIDSTLTSVTGAYDMGSSAGTYKLRAYLPGYTTDEVTLSINLGQTLTGIDFKISPNFALFTGKVKDDSDNLLSNVLISLSAPNSGGTVQSVTDGSFSITQLIGNTFVLTAKKSGYSEYIDNAYKISDGETKSLNIALVKLVGSISGTVKDAGNNLISGASVYVLDTTSKTTYSTITDAVGIYKFSSLALGTYSVSTVKENYSSSYVETVTLALGSQTKTVSISDLVKNTGTISGKLTDYKNNPISSASISVRGSKGSGSTLTDINGNFTILDMFNDSYLVTGQKKGFVTDSTIMTTNTAGVLKLNVSNVKISGTVVNQAGSPLGFAVTVKAVSGQTTLTTTSGLDGSFSFDNGSQGAAYNVFSELFKDGYTNDDSSFTVPSSATLFSGIKIVVVVSKSSISGKVTETSSGAGIAAVSVNLKNTSTNTEVTALSNSDGSYSAGYLMNGNYTITPSKSGYVFNPASASTTVAIEGSNSVSFTGDKKVGTVIVNTTDAVSAAVMDSVSLNLVSKDSKYSFTGLTASGTYTFKDVPNGDYVLQASKNLYSSLNTPVDITVTTGSSATKNLSLKKNNSSLRGSVKNGGVIAGATVLYRNTASAQSYSVSTSATGEYVFASLPDGAAKVYAVYSGYASDTLSINLSGSDEINKTINLTPTFVKIEGSVKYNNSGLSGVSVTAVSSGTFTTTSDNSGYFSFNYLPIKVGNTDTTIYKITISGTDIQSQSYSLPIAGTQKGTTVGLPSAFIIPSGKVTAVVSDGTGTGLPGVQLTFVQPNGTQSSVVTGTSGKFETQAKLSSGTYKLNLIAEDYLIPNEVLTVFNLADNTSQLTKDIPLRYKVVPLASMDASAAANITAAYKGTLPSLTAKLKYSVENGISDSVDMYISASDNMIKGAIPALYTLSKVSYQIIVRENSGIVYTSSKYTLIPEAVGILTSVGFSPSIDKMTFRKNDTYEVSLLIRDGKSNSLLSSFAGSAHTSFVKWTYADTAFSVTYPKSNDSTVARFTALKDGVYKISATAVHGPDKNRVTVSQDAGVTIGSVLLKEITLNNGNINLLSNTSAGTQFGYTGKDTASKSVALGVTLKWSVNPTLAGNIDSTGFFKPADATVIGTLTVTATDQISGKKGSTDLSVYADITKTSDVTLTDKNGMTIKISPNAVSVPGKFTLGKSQFGPAKKYYTPVGSRTSYVSQNKQYFLQFSSDQSGSGDSVAVPMTIQLPTDVSLKSFDGAKTLGYYNSVMNEWSILSSSEGTSANTLTTSITKFGEYSVLAENEALGISNAAVLPTPFSPKVAPLRIGYKLKTQLPPANVTIRIFNMRGELVRILKQNDFQYPGFHGSKSVGGLDEITWNGKTDDGYDALNGRYIIEISAKDPSGETKQIIPVVLVK